MSGFIEGTDRSRTTLFPDRLEDWIGEDRLMRVVDVFVDELDLRDLGFARSDHARTGRPGYHPAVLLKLFIYGYLNRFPSSRRLEREAGGNVELMWLLGRRAPDHKTIADRRCEPACQALWPHPAGDRPVEIHGKRLGGYSGWPDLADRFRCARNGDQGADDRSRGL